MAEVKIKIGSKELQFESKTFFIYTAIIAQILATLLFSCCYGVKIVPSLLYALIVSGITTGIAAINVNAYLKKDDKTLHVYAGMIIAFLSAWLWYTFTATGVQISGLFGLGCGILAGAAKELIHDKWMGRGVASWADFFATFYGSFPGTVIFIVFFWVLTHG